MNIKLRASQWIFVGFTCYLGLLAIIAVMLHRASPGPESQEIWGGAIGNWKDSGVAFFSGRRLKCAKDATINMTVCTIEIAGKTLTIHAHRAPTPEFSLNGVCRAFYNGQEWKCQIAPRHVGVFWFAYMESGMALDKEHISGLQRKYFFENLSENAYVNGMFVVSVLSMGMAVFVTNFWCYAHNKNKVICMLLPFIIGVVSFFISLFTAGFFTNGFWD